MVEHAWCDDADDIDREKMGQGSNLAPVYRFTDPLIFRTIAIIDSFVDRRKMRDDEDGEMNRPAHERNVSSSRRTILHDTTPRWQTERRKKRAETNGQVSSWTDWRWLFGSCCVRKMLMKPLRKKSADSHKKCVNISNENFNSEASHRTFFLQILVFICVICCSFPSFHSKQASIPYRSPETN